MFGFVQPQMKFQKLGEINLQISFFMKASKFYGFTVFDAKNSARLNLPYLTFYPHRFKIIALGKKHSDKAKKFQGVFLSKVFFRPWGGESADQYFFVGKTESVRFFKRTV